MMTQSPATSPAAELSDADFSLFRTLMAVEAGVHLGDNKKTLVVSRLGRRVRDLAGGNFRAYHSLLKDDPVELRFAVDVLTTNETFFFREPQHFQFLGREILARASGKLRIWSAACSTGEEPYSIALVCADRGVSAQILATDVNASVLGKGRAALYPLERSRELPAYYLKKFGLRGVRSMGHYFTFTPEVRRMVTFDRMNLVAGALPGQEFDCIFLRNVMIYFSRETKEQVLRRLAGCLKIGGYLMIGHSETLHGLGANTGNRKAFGFQLVRPAIYQRVVE